MLWHVKFAHLNVQALKQMVLKEMVDDLQSLKLDDFKQSLNCISCTMAKQRRMSYKRNNSRSTTCYDRLMSDVCSIGLETIGGNRYFQLILDEASRYKWCYLLEHKSEATRNMKNLILRLKKQHVINKVTFDRGGEFVNNNMKSFLTEHDIEFRPTNAYTPEENSLVERQNGILMNKVRAIREDTCLPESLWGEILMYVVEVDMNSTKALKDMTPYQKITGMKPVVQTSMGYRLLNLHTGELIERRDVSFREDITVDNNYLEKLLTKRYKGRQVVLPANIPFVHLPVNAVLETVHIPQRTTPVENQLVESDSEVAVRPQKLQRVASVDSSSDESEDVEFSGRFHDVADNENTSTSSSADAATSFSSGSNTSSCGSTSTSTSTRSSDGSSGSPLLSPRSSTSGSPAPSSSSTNGTANNHPLTPTRAPTTTTLRRSTRQHRQPTRYNPSWEMSCTLMTCILIGVVSELLNPTTVRQALASEHAMQWRAAMNVEYESLMKNMTWELVPRPRLDRQKGNM
ncbi:Gag-pol Polyprotein [Phytophthora megakarya]|uniref:Gag-pol Polyprotein n=1 Tax=Phytophthora megakarya TaxID=4795 RepID=A0A225V9S7_9STRA|nr:Gag-pol Polyprotein [Phytophthora megakarya]